MARANYHLLQIFAPGKIQKIEQLGKQLLSRYRPGFISPSRFHIPDRYRNPPPQSLNIQAAKHVDSIRDRLTGAS
jgi:hypothetical protein